MTTIVDSNVNFSSSELTSDPSDIVRDLLKSKRTPSKSHTKLWLNRNWLWNFRTRTFCAPPGPVTWRRLSTIWRSGLTSTRQIRWAIDCNKRSSDVTLNTICNKKRGPKSIGMDRLILTRVDTYTQHQLFLPLSRGIASMCVHVSPWGDFYCTRWVNQYLKLTKTKRKTTPWIRTYSTLTHQACPWPRQQQQQLQ